MGGRHCVRTLASGARHPTRSAAAPTINAPLRRLLLSLILVTVFDRMFIACARDSMTGVVERPREVQRDEKVGKTTTWSLLRKKAHSAPSRTLSAQLFVHKGELGRHMRGKDICILTTTYICVKSGLPASSGASPTGQTGAFLFKLSLHVPAQQNTYNFPKPIRTSTGL